MAELKMLVGLLFALSLRSSSVEPMTSVAAAQDASLKMPAAAVLLNKLVLTASDKAAVAAASAPIAVALAALIDCCVAPLARVAALSCEAARGDDTTFDVPASGDRMSATDDHGATGSATTKPERRGGTDVSAGETRNAVAITSHGPAASAATAPS
jgi:histidyl-tRNA synthetase